MTPARKKPPIAATFTAEQAAAWRAHRHGLDREPRKADPVKVAASLCGLHAQVMSSAELTLWARVGKLTRAEISKAIWDDRRLVKTWAMRGTLHLLPSDEFGMWSAALGTYDHFRKGVWFRSFGISEEELDGLIAAIDKVLRKKIYARADLADAVAKETGSKKLAEQLRSGWGSFLKPAAFNGSLCFAPSEGNNVRFVHPAKWLKGLKKIVPDEGLAGMTDRYLALNGPATREEHARWWGTPPPKSQRLIEALGDKIVAVEVDGNLAYMHEALLQDALDYEPTGRTSLLPAFDQYVVMSSRVPAVLKTELKPKVFRKAAWLSAVVAADGAMKGIWKFERKGKRLPVTVEAFGRFSKAQKTEIEKEIARLGEFMAGEPEVSWGPLT